MKLLKLLTIRGLTNPVEIMDAYMRRGPVRNTLRRNVRRRVSSFPSRKVGRGVFCDGPMEFKAVRWLEVRRDVVTFLEQPMQFELDKKHNYVTDLLILFSNNTLGVWDPKPDNLYNDEFKVKEKRVKEMLDPYDIEFNVMTESLLPSGAHEENIELLIRYRERDTTSKLPLLTNLSSLPQTFAAIQEGCLGTKLSLADVFALIHQNYLSADLTKQLDGRAQLFSPHDMGLKV